MSKLINVKKIILEKIKGRVHTKKHFVLFAAALITLTSSILGAGYYQIVLAQSQQPTPAPQATTPSKFSPVEVVGQQGISNELGLEGGSYAGEIVSKMDVNVYSPREGVIAKLTVNIGDTVKQWQSIGYLSVAAEFDQVATTAEKSLDVDTSKNKRDAVNTQLDEIRNRFNGRKSSAEAAKNAKINNANKDFSLGTITSEEKEERIKEADSDYSEVVTEADNEISTLIREQKEAQKEAEAAEALSKKINNGVDRNIYALRAGVVSGVFKNVGDYVTGEDRIAAIGIAKPTLKDRCVRFRVPGNQPPPKVGDVVTITSPGEPFSGLTAKITGVGTSLDDGGHYSAEAFFEEIVDWPVHAQVRVIPEFVTSNQILVPLSAVWFDNEGVTSVWIANSQNKITAYNVTTGRAIGDRIEIKEGLQSGDRVVIQPKSDFRNGDIIQESGSSTNQNNGEEVTPAGDGHDHEH